jgi:dienelactone hydrolase
MSNPIERQLYELTRWRASGPFEPIPVLLYHRADLPGAKPVVVYYHGVVQRKEIYLDSHPMARRLADAGFVVALPDAPGHGERPAGASVVERLRASLPHEFCADIEQARDEASALLDWLAGQEGIDGGRLAVAGVSMGGFTAAAVAAAARERLRSAVCIAGSGGLVECMAATDSIAPGKWGPLDRSLDAETQDRIQRIDPLHYPARYAPLPLLLLHGALDTWNPHSTTERFHAALVPHYASAPERLRLSVAPNAPHWPPALPMIEEAVEWLRSWGLEAGG